MTRPICEECGVPIVTLNKYRRFHPPCLAKRRNEERHELSEAEIDAIIAAHTAQQRYLRNKAA
jgi:hypothetical protein